MKLQQNAGGDRIDSIKWHPGFCGAAALEFSANRDDLEFLEEHQLNKEPLRVDLLIIKKVMGAVIENEIGRIFRGHNVIEYKSPDDNLTIDDFYNTLGYACIYKGHGKTVHQVPAEELTVSLFRESYPHKMAAELQRSGMAIEEQFQGIYYIFGPLPFPVQIVATGELKPEHPSLRILSKNADENDVRAFITEIVGSSTPANRKVIDAVLEASVAANRPLYENIRRSFGMCDVLRELMKDDLALAERKGRDEGILEGIQKGKNEGILEGIQRGKSEGVFQSLTNVMKSLSLDADGAMDALCIPAEERELYRSQLQ